MISYLVRALNGAVIAVLALCGVAVLAIWAGTGIWVVFSMAGNLYRLLSP